MSAKIKVDLSRTEKVWQDYSGLVAVWSFGSAQDGKIAFGSDLDIALLFAEAPEFETLCNIRADLQEMLELEEIDLMNLNTASVVSAMEAISGTPLFCRDLGKRAEFASLISRQYEDDMAQLRRHYSESTQ
ncbi:MAG: nucleotidyltransferase domain-containing protein [Candidatus Electrothrix aestuarii]|uniref:Nucleotidyltransferase domain-containing protein n=1 Tax=Candidatus Electrothrix aestuarii TaxID=3062594 RepID=A0AAU8LTR3_9BACT|nr:nucleotidyltransferase domain-containing protein [Candidatus Electrothrix aestuarii]